MNIGQKLPEKLKAFIPALLWGAVIFFLSTLGGVAPPNLVPDLLEPDKLAHAGAYFILATLTTWGFLRNGRRFRQAALFSFVGCVSYGLLLEMVQYYFFPDRFFEWWDAAANTSGCLLSVVASYFLMQSSFQNRSSLL